MKERKRHGRKEIIGSFLVLNSKFLEESFFSENSPSPIGMSQVMRDVLGHTEEIRYRNIFSEVLGNFE